ncbi:MAG: hypothetical protein EAZ30_14535 [Betaproteobacteria bacterium]|nr:MAG: hypothetical protein EAZ43_15695 [Betaproteobacteria bacterium]TAG45855.1 MAG: hypothetical protein EAZ30_14535 [Betaproteobacteria bacterium]
MKFLLIFAVFVVLFVVSWPLAIAALILLPIFWLVALPFRLLGVIIGAVFAFLKALLYLPARLIGGRAR